MPYYAFREIWTPLVIFSIRFYRELHYGGIYAKFGKRHRKKLTLTTATTRSEP